MEVILKDNFITTMVGYGDLEENEAINLWNENKDDFIEDCWTEIDSLMADILTKHKG